MYGMTYVGRCSSPSRQLVALTTFSDLVGGSSEARPQRDAVAGRDAG